MRSLFAVVVLATLVVIACITINVYFPEQAVKDLSEQIEAQVQKRAAGETGATAPTPAPTSAPTPTPSVDPLAAILSLGVSTAWADQAEVAAPEISNPAIRTIIASRAKRLEAINGWKARGVLGENNQALLEVRNLDAVSGLKERAEVQKLVKDENADREQLFREIAAAKSVELSQLPKIRETYASTLREQARPGDWIQQPDGTWVQKAKS